MSGAHLPYTGASAPGTRPTWALSVDGTGGNFKLSVLGVVAGGPSGGGNQTLTTGNIAENANAATIEAALDALLTGWDVDDDGEGGFIVQAPYMGVGVAVHTDAVTGGDGVSLEQTDLGNMESRTNFSTQNVAGTSRPSTTALRGTVQDRQYEQPLGETTTLDSPTLTGEEVTIEHDGVEGTWMINVDLGGVDETTDPIDFDANAAAIEAALEALTIVGADNVTVTGTNPFTLDFSVGELDGEEIAVDVDKSALVSGYTDQVSEIEVDATGGTFTVLVELDESGAQETTDLDFDIDAADLQTALLALSNLDASDVVVTGGPGADEPLVLTFADDAAGIAVTVTTDAANLTGGAGTATVTETTAGGEDVFDATVTIEVATEGDVTYDDAFDAKAQSLASADSIRGFTPNTAFWPPQNV